MNQELHEMLVDQLKDAYSAEKQGLRAMQKAARKISTPALKEGMQAHIELTQTQLERVEQALEKAGSKPGRKVCEAMRGLVEEQQHEIEEQDEKGPILDLVIVAAQQRMEHYEIAAYGTMAELARAMGHDEIVALLEQTLEEEKNADLKLTEITRGEILPQLKEDDAGEDDEDGADDKDGEDDEKAGAGAAKPARKPAPRRKAS